MSRNNTLNTTTILIVLGTACKAPSASVSTSEWGLSGVALVEGVVTDTSRALLDSVRVGGGVLDAGQALYVADQSITTGRDGRYSIRVERRGAAPLPVGDSVRLVLNAQSLKARDRKADGTPQAASVQVWLRFRQPPSPPYSLPVNISMPFAR
ncbi:MAG: hypothetical protein IT353_07570 [Gemmatimonadaceae bacterium]|nr:hypothetical protein [Gemmatimonadaceae bacterium]